MVLYRKIEQSAIAQPVTLAKSQSTSPEAPNKVVAPQKTVLTVPPPASPAPAAPASMPETPTTRSDSKKKGGRSSPNFSLEETHYLLSLIEKYGALNQNDYEVVSLLYFILEVIILIISRLLLRWKRKVIRNEMPQLT